MTLSLHVTWKINWEQCIFTLTCSRQTVKKPSTKSHQMVALWHFYHSQTGLRKDNVFTHVCLPTGWGRPMWPLHMISLTSQRSLWNPSPALTLSTHHTGISLDKLESGWLAFDWKEFLLSVFSTGIRHRMFIFICPFSKYSGNHLDIIKFCQFY